MKKAEARRLAALCWGEAYRSSGPDPRVTTVCRLWAGMGHIYRLSDDTSGNVIIVKHVRLPSSSIATASRGDRRKADSYLVEVNFYRHVANRLLGSGVGVPRPLHAETREDQIVICMTELRGRSLRGDRLDDVRSVLDWMAKFHSLYWGNEAVDGVVGTAGLHAVGTYWHLDTRPDEHSNMSRSGLSGRLRLSARAIDRQLKKSPFQCLVHGDPKEANILLMDNADAANNDGANVVTAALYDFQYCGKGPPAVDVAYFLCSSVDDDDTFSTDALVKNYHERLVGHLKASLGAEASPHRPHPLIPTLEQMNELLDLAICDYYRFLCGWGHWGRRSARPRRGSGPSWIGWTAGRCSDRPKSTKRRWSGSTDRDCDERRE